MEGRLAEVYGYGVRRTSELLSGKVEKWVLEV